MVRQKLTSALTNRNAEGFKAIIDLIGRHFSANLQVEAWMPLATLRDCRFEDPHSIIVWSIFWMRIGQMENVLPPPCFTASLHLGTAIENVVIEQLTENNIIVETVIVNGKERWVWMS